MGKKEKKYDRKIDLSALNQKIAQESLSRQQENENSENLANTQLKENINNVVEELSRLDDLSKNPEISDKKRELYLKIVGSDDYSELFDRYSKDEVSEEILGKFKNYRDKIKEILIINLENKNMAKENPTANTAEELKTPAPETIKDSEKPIETKLDPEKVAADFSPENQGFFSKMSEKGKNLAGKFYEGLYKIPGVNRIVGKMEIAYNQFWADKHEAKAANLKGRMDAVDLGIGALDQSKKDIETVIENLKQQKMPGVESLQLKLRDVDEKKMDLQNKKDKIQTKFEYRDDKKKLYTNERDRVADKLIGRYNEKLEPMEKQLEKLQDSKDRMDLQIAATGIKHKESMAKLADMENNKTKIENALRAAGMSDRQVRNFEAVKVLETLLADGREKIRTEKEELTRRKAEINQKIAKVDAKANPYRDKRGEFARVKERRPVEMKVETRKREEEFKGEENVEVKTRQEKEVSVENQEKSELRTFISHWNNFIYEKYKHTDLAKANRGIDVDRLLHLTGLGVDNKLDFGDFKNISEKYYKVMKSPRGEFDKDLDEFKKSFDERWK